MERGDFLNYTNIIHEFNRQLDLVLNEAKRTNDLEKRLLSYCSQYNNLNSSSYQLHLTPDKDYNYDLLVCTDNGDRVFRSLQFTLSEFVDYVTNLETELDRNYPCTSIIHLNDSQIYKHFLDFIITRVK